LQRSLAATGQIYISPASKSLQQGSSTALAVRINPGTAVDGVEVTLSYDKAKLEFQSIDAGGSGFDTALPGNTGGNGSVKLFRGSLSSPVTTDKLIANVNFKALVGSGSASISVSGNATSAGNYTNPSVAGSVISFTAVPNPPTPPPAPGPSPSPSPGPSPSPSPSTKPSPSPSPSTKPSPTPATPPASGGPTLTVQPTEVEFTKAGFSITTSTPSRLYIEYGIDGKLTVSTPQTELGTKHTVALDNAFLIPGTLYSYRVVAVDAKGNKTEGDIATIKTKGYTVRVAVLDKNNKPVKKSKLTLHSDPMEATTDKTGVAEFTDVAPGNHTLTYESGGKKHEKALTINNDFTVGADGKQTASVQTVSVIYDDLTQRSLPIWYILIPIAVFGIIFLISRQTKRNKFNSHHFAGVQQSSNGSTIVSGSSTAANPGDTTSGPSPTQTPGSTVEPNSPTDQEQK
jgi:hypothetical protein